jgi:hypothetical protein
MKVGYKHPQIVCEILFVGKQLQLGQYETLVLYQTNLT